MSGAPCEGNVRYQFVLLYTVGADAIRAAAEDINAAVRDGALPVGEDSGLPLHRFPLAEAVGFVTRAMCRMLVGGPRRLAARRSARKTGSDQGFSLGYGVIGNTADSGSVVLGSSPGTPAVNRFTQSDTVREPYSARRVLALLLVGLLGGTLSGAFGVGGGTIMVPLLIWLLGFDQRRAAATSLAAIVPAAISGAASYTVAGEIDLAAALLIARRRDRRIAHRHQAAAHAAARLAALAVRRVPRAGRDPHVLRGARPRRGARAHPVDDRRAGRCSGVVMGIAAGMFGVGGGVLAVPVLIAFFGVGDLVAKGTSLIAMIPTAATGTIANTRAGLVRLGDGLIVGRVRGRRELRRCRARVPAAAAALGGAVRHPDADRRRGALAARDPRGAGCAPADARRRRLARLAQREPHDGTALARPGDRLETRGLEHRERSVVQVRARRARRRPRPGTPRSPARRAPARGRPRPSSSAAATPLRRWPTRTTKQDTNQTSSASRSSALSFTSCEFRMRRYAVRCSTAHQPTGSSPS